MRRFDRSDDDRLARAAPPPDSRSNKRLRESDVHVKSKKKRARQDELPKVTDIEDGIKIVDESIEHVSSRLKALRDELEKIRNDVLSEHIESLKSNKSVSTERFATERRRFESLSLHQLLRLERKEVSERLSKDGEPTLLNSLNANGSPVLTPRRNTTLSSDSSPRPSPKELLLSPDISLDTIFPPMPKPWKMRVDAKMLRRITEANRKLVRKEQKETSTSKSIDNLFDKVTNEVKASFEKSRDCMLKVLKQRKAKWHDKELRFAKMYVQKLKVWKENIKAWEKSREEESGDLAWTSRSRTAAGSSNNLLQGGSSSSPRRTEEKTTKEKKKSGKYLTRADVVRSEYEQQRLLDEMTQMEKQRTRYLKTVASIVPYIPCYRDRHYAAMKEDKNGLYDPMKDHNEHKLRKAWSDAERLIFLDKFLQYPKDFHRISAFIANKNTRDCVAYYYATKKSIPYKHLLAEQLQRRRGKMSWYVMKETLKVLNIADVSEEDLGAQCTDMDYREACLVASGEVDTNSNESDSESETDIAGYTSIRDKAKFLSKILRIDDNLHTIDADELRRHPAKFIEEMNSKKKKDAEKVPLITSESASSNGEQSSSSRSKKTKEKSSSARSNKWMPEEKDAYVKHLKIFGKDWTSLHKKIPTKTIAQIKNFYQNYKNKLQLDKIVAESMKRKK